MSAWGKKGHPREKRGVFSGFLPPPTNNIKTVVYSYAAKQDGSVDDDTVMAGSHIIELDDEDDFNT